LRLSEDVTRVQSSLAERASFRLIPLELKVARHPDSNIVELRRRPEARHGHQYHR
jgi:hypothetical protein